MVGSTEIFREEVHGVARKELGRARDVGVVVLESGRGDTEVVPVYK